MFRPITLVPGKFASEEHSHPEACPASSQVGVVEVPDLGDGSLRVRMQELLRSTFRPSVGCVKHATCCAVSSRLSLSFCAGSFRLSRPARKE